MDKAMLTEVKAILKSLVLSCPDKITVEKLNRDYRDVEGQFIPFRQLGYGNLEQFLHSVPDTLRVFGSGPTAMVCFVANEKSDHIHDMIMRQKKPKSKARTKPKSVVYNRSNAVQASSWQKHRKISGQQLSPYQSVNRNQMTKTLQINPKTPVMYSFPQPNGILLNPTVCAIKNGIVQSVMAQAQINQNKINQLNSALKNQCRISNTPPPLPRSQNRKESFPTEKKSIQVKPNTKNQSDKEKLNNITISPSTEIQRSLIHIKPPTARKVSIKHSDKVDDMPKLNNVSSHLKEPVNNLSSTQESQEAENIRSIKTVRSTQPKRCFEDSTDYIEDPDEAIPSFAAKTNVFCLDFPKNSVPYGNKIAPHKLSDEITVGSCLKIFISEIHSPFKFWFHIHKENHELDLLMYQIEHYYSRLEPEDLCIPLTCLTPGQVCAALYKDMWHRAEIVAPPVNKSIKVSFMDYGTVTEVEIENVKFLASFFGRLPAQALRGCLSHIKPRHYHWSHEATNYFLTLVAELMLYAKISEIDEENNVVYMILCDTNGDEVVKINSSLVENRYALYNEDWRMEKIRQNGKRLHHPREDFPTFSMIETGEYPSFNELVSLQQRGIDYETIYDIIIFNQASILNKHESASEGLKNLPYFLTTSNPFRSDILVDLYATTKAM